MDNNSLVVECGDRNRFIGYNDIYLSEVDMTSYSNNESFDREGSITSAIDYVVTEELPQMYVLEGHGEAEFSPVFREQIEFQEFGVSFIIEDVKDYGQYGLNSPSCTIHIETSDGQFEILLGDYSDMDSERYVSIGDGNVYLVKNDPMDDFEIKLCDLILHDEVPKFDSAEEIQFAGTENYHIVHQENSDTAYSEEDVYFVKKENDYQPLDTDHVENYLQAVKDTTLKNYVAYNASEGDLATYGLEDPDLEITVQYTIQNDEEQETGSFAFSIARDPKGKQKEEKSSDNEPEKSEEITAYARVGDSRIIYKITGEDYKTLMSAPYDELRHQKVLPVAFEDIYQVDISLEGKNYTLSADKKKKKTVWSYKDEELKIDKFKRALMALKTSDFEVDRPEGKEEISLTLHLENENYPEFRVDLYRHDFLFILLSWLGMGMFIHVGFRKTVDKPGVFAWTLHSDLWFWSNHCSLVNGSGTG